MKKLGIAVMLFAIIVVASAFGADRQAAFVERYTNTSCSPCVPAGVMMEGLMEEYSPDIAALQIHVDWPSSSDPFYLYCSADNEARWTHYGVTGVPTLCVDGKKLSSWSTTSSEVDTRLGTSTPLTINMDITSTRSPELTTTIDIDVDVETAVTGSGNKLFVAITQTNNEYAGANGEMIHYDVLRELLPSSSGQDIDLSAVGTQNFSFPLTWDAAVWDSFDMKIVAWVQNMSAGTSSFNVHNANWMWWPMSYRYTYDPGDVDTVVSADGMYELGGGELANIGLTDDSYMIKLETDMPTSWSASFCAGVLCFPDSGVVDIVTGSAEEVVVDVTTSGDGIGIIDMILMSMGSGYVDTFTYIVAQNPAVLLVDDDAGSTNETYYATSLNNLGEVFYTVHRSEGEISATQMMDYEIVIWFTSGDYGSVVSTSDTTAIGQYLDAGGSLFMTSQDLGYFCDYYSITGWYQNRFKASYLSDDAGIYNIAGVSGSYFDGISCSIFSGDGADFTPYPSEITPATGGDAAINYAGGSNPCAGVVHDGTYKLVYFAFPWEVIGSQVDRDTVLIRVLSFLRGDISVNESLLKPESPQIVSAQPNPFNAAVNIEFDARNSGDAELSIYDASGRKVTTLFKGKVQPGEYNRVWDATDDSGNKLPSGIYLTKLEIEGKSITKKIVLIK